MCQTWWVCSGKGIRSRSTLPSGPLKRHSSTLVACSEKREKFTPAPSQVAPKGYGLPGMIFMLLASVPPVFTSPDLLTGRSHRTLQEGHRKAREHLVQRQHDLSVVFNGRDGFSGQDIAIALTDPPIWKHYRRVSPYLVADRRFFRNLGGL